MSDLYAKGLPVGLHDPQITSKWGWFVALGAFLALAGIFAFGDIVAFTLISVIFIGAMLMAGGIFQIVHAFMTKVWSAFALNLIMGLLYVVGGLLIMREPVQGSVILTLFLLVVLLVGGVIRIGMALQNRHVAGWWLMLLGGIVSIIVAILLYVTLPWSGLWVLGVLIAMELLVHGFSWIGYGFSLRSVAHSAG